MATETTGLQGLAERYAAALYDLAETAGKLDPTADDLRQIGVMIDTVPDFRHAIGNPTLSRAVQSRAVLAVLDKIGTSDLTRRFVGVVAGNRRLLVLPAIIRAFLAEMARRRGEIVAELSSARPLSEAQSMAVLEALRAQLGPKIILNQKVDESLIGGLVVRVGSRLIDDSLKSKLVRLQIAMKGVA